MCISKCTNSPPPPTHTPSTPLPLTLYKRNEMYRYVRGSSHRRSGRGGGRGSGSDNVTDMQPSTPTMNDNPNFSRGVPGRSTYSYGTRRPPAAMHHFVSPEGRENSQPGASPNSGFFKRLIPTRFSSRRYRRRYTCVPPFSVALFMAYTVKYAASVVHEASPRFFGVFFRNLRLRWVHVCSKHPLYRYRGNCMQSRGEG